jgi:hypothetical protein
MSKITLFFMLISGIVLAQQPQSYLELPDQNYTNEFSSETTTVTNNSSQGIIATYVAKVLFDIGIEENCSESTVTYEDFLGGPLEIFDCGLTMSNAGDGCYDPGELEIGFQISASNGSNTVSIPAGAIGNADPLAGAITFAEYTIIEFTPSVYAIAMDLWENNFPLTDIRVYGETGDLIETIQWDVPTNLQVFFGMIADEPISKIEVQGEQDSGELVGNLYFGATCEALSVNDHILSQLSVYPNPTNDIVTIKMPPNVELVSMKLFDVLGNLVLKNPNLTQLDVSNLSSGLYLLDIITTAGTISKKIVRK